MQERFNKDLEEIKRSHYIMNNAINEIKNTLEATNSRIMEAEDRISEIEDRMVEINESERKKEKWRKDYGHQRLSGRQGDTPPYRGQVSPMR